MDNHHTCSEFTALISRIKQERAENLLEVKRRGECIVQVVKINGQIVYGKERLALKAD